jgi:hypothetical protein
MEVRHNHDAEYARLISTTRYTPHDLVVDGITALAAVVVIGIVLFQLGSI